MSEEDFNVNNNPDDNEPWEVTLKKGEWEMSCTGPTPYTCLDHCIDTYLDDHGSPKTSTNDFMKKTEKPPSIEEMREEGLNPASSGDAMLFSLCRKRKPDGPKEGREDCISASMEALKGSEEALKDVGESETEE